MPDMERAVDRFPRPPYDPEIEPLVRATVDKRESFESSFDIEKLREEALRREAPRTEALLRDKRVTCEDLTIPGPRGDLTVTVVRPAVGGAGPAAGADAAGEGGRPCVFYIHGGAMVRSDRYAGLDQSVVWAAELGAVTVSVEYGLAPENAGTGPARDCHAALRWVARNPAALGIDARRLILYGVSAGGGLAAAVALMLLGDEHEHEHEHDDDDNSGGDGDGGAGPTTGLRGLLLKAPMLDDRNAASVSGQQYATGPMYNSTVNRAAWGCLLGERAGAEEGAEEGAAAVSAYEAPGRARAEDLRGLPPTYVDCGAADPFRDDAAAFAGRLWAAGVPAEFHAWPGCPHAFDRLAPAAAVSVLAAAVRIAWMRRVLGLGIGDRHW